jgi:hypothetical protein
VRSLSTPAAIVAGFGMLSVANGLGLYFGLRGRSGAPVDSIQSVATLTGATSRVAGGAGSEAVAAPAIVLPSAVTADEAKGAIASQHGRLVDTCWTPSVARNPLPAQLKLTLVVSYAEDGHLVMHSLKPEVPGARPDMTSCVYGALKIPSVSPPGHKVTVNVPIAFP